MAQVRPAVSTDAAAVAAVGRAAFTRQYEGLMDPANYTLAADRWYSPDAIEASIDACSADPSAHFLIAERDAGIVGFLHYDEAGPEPELHRIYLAEEERGRGTGSVLMEELHARLPATAEYTLAVVEGNDAAVRFYCRHGLEIERRVSGKRYYIETAGLDLPDSTVDFGLLLMRYRRSPGSGSPRA